MTKEELIELMDTYWMTSHKASNSELAEIILNKLNADQQTKDIALDRSNIIVEKNQKLADAYDEIEGLQSQLSKAEADKQELLEFVTHFNTLIKNEVIIISNDTDDDYIEVILNKLSYLTEKHNVR